MLLDGREAGRYRATGLVGGGRRVQPWATDSYAPAGGVLDDMARLATSRLDGSGPGRRSLSRSAVSRPAGQGGSGMFWVIDSVRGNRTVVWHNGQTGGYSSFIALYPQARRAVVVLADVARESDQQRIAFGSAAGSPARIRRAGETSEVLSTLQIAVSATRIWTVGHSNHSFDAFAALLQATRIEFVVDVRSYPQSRVAPHFNREQLESTLSELLSVRYVFLGDELGGRPSNDAHYDDDGHALYGPMSQEPGFRLAVDRLAAGAARHRIALMCSEGRPEHCHRRLLVGKVLTERDVELRHILPNGLVLTETTVTLNAGGQAALFVDDDVPWRSTQSVSHRQRLSASSRG